MPSLVCQMTRMSNKRIKRNANIEMEKTVLLQKKDSEGFGFVLRGAKAQTPIEEFTPTPAFPALQYLESVDEGGVAWRAGLRMGDFLIEVNGQNVVKVGHRQVVNMIRQGGNSLMVKVVMVTRNPDMEEGARKKIPQQSKRLSTPAIALRSKSMTSELEEMGKKQARIRFFFIFLADKSRRMKEHIKQTQVMRSDGELERGINLDGSYLVAGTRRRRLVLDDGLNAFRCVFRGATMSLPALPLQVTPPRNVSPSTV
uniref:PDZ domain-containing protein n=1 Tax=Poecilia latipinna TaxID=48699 RepID=A0A3B3UVU7_9TELE